MSESSSPFRDAARNLRKVLLCKLRTVPEADDTAKRATPWASPLSQSSARNLQFNSSRLSEVTDCDVLRGQRL